MKNFLIPLLGLIVIVSSCQKRLDKDENTQTNENPQVQTEFNQLEVPSDFDWSSVAYNGLLINVLDQSNEYNAELEGMPIQVSTVDGDLIQNGIVYEGQFELTLTLPRSTKNVLISCPETGEQKEVSIEEGEVNFNMSCEDTKSFKSLQDSDGDQVVDKYDEFPYDPERAFSGGYFSGKNVSSLKDNRSNENFYFHFFEDLWPNKGDYDFNDIIIALQFSVTTNNRNYIVGGHVKWYIWSIGSSKNFPTGLGHEFTKYIPQESRFEYMDPMSLTNFTSDFEALYRDPGSNASNNLILYDNVFDHLDPYYNNCGDGETEGQTWGVPGTPIKIEYDFSINQNQKLRGLALWPYLFLTNDNGRQVRTYGMPPSATADMGLLNTGQDVSPTSWDWTPGNSFVYPLTGASSFYKTENLHPWGLEIVATNFKVPLEKVSILEAYPQFQDWAESGGTENINWYENPDESKVFDVMPYFEP